MSALFEALARELRVALPRAGWSIADLREVLVHVGARELSYTCGSLRREELRAEFKVIPNCGDKDVRDLNSPTPAVRQWFGRTKVRACVRDAAAAERELAAFVPLLDGNFQAALDAIESRGWRIVPEETRDDMLRYDAPPGLWIFRAEKSPGLRLWINAAFEGATSRVSPTHTHDDGWVEVHLGKKSARVDVYAMTAAEELAASLRSASTTGAGA